MDNTPLAHLSAFSQWLNAPFSLENDGRVTAVVTFRMEAEGAPGYLHGGIAASLLDEAMGGAVWAAGLRAMTVNLTTNYRQAVPLNAQVRIEGWVERVEGRKAFTAGVLRLPDGSMAVEAAGVFVQVPLRILQQGAEMEQKRLTPESPDTP